MFHKILIANRGEIAVRIIRACKEMGIQTVAVFSEADRDALHVSLADESYCIGGAAVTDSYLNMSAILTVADATRTEALHPGYGLLSENPKFARLCEECNIVFIGPRSEVIEKMGSKDEARRTMREAGVPVVPGVDCVTTVADAKAAAEEIGYPVLIKARAGGGGRGIRIVSDPEQMAKNFASASSEAEKAFGDGGLYLEKFLRPVKHVEVQLLCDNFGRVVCLGDRDCSLQRKNQKLLEECPAPLLTEELREEMFAAAALAARAVDYTGAGTVEFLVDRDNKFYFMEMNTRLQVEHSVTEMATNIDIVKWQIRVAANLPLGFEQKDVAYSGHAIECRINAENPLENFRPNCGEIKLLHVPGGPQVRFDTAIYQNYFVPPYYDSMIGKLITCATTREEAIRKMKSALSELVIDGVEQNTEFQIEVLSDEDFVSGSYYTDFLEKKGYIR